MTRDSKQTKWVRILMVLAAALLMFCGSRIHVQAEEKESVSSVKAEKVSIESDNDAGTFEITIKGVKSPVDISAVMVPVWCKKNQSDIYWYEAEKNDAGDYVVKGDLSKHKYHLGTYQADVYIKGADESMTFAGRSQMKFEIRYDRITLGEGSDEKLYPVTVSGLVVPGGFDEVLFPVWSKADGQDDLKWYHAEKDGQNYTAEIDISNHKTPGDYEIHVYAVNRDGSKVYVGKTDELKVDSSASGTVSVAQIDEEKGKITAEIRVEHTSSPLKEVSLTAWCAEDQSDLYSYPAELQEDGTYLATVSVSKHKDHLGIYKMEAYAVLENDVPVPAGKTEQYFSPANYISVRKTDQIGERRITLKNVNPWAENVRFAVWSMTGEQDDLEWNDAEKQEDGSWSASVPVGYYKHDGKFAVHAFVDDEFVKGKTFNVDISEMGKNGWYYENGLKLYYDHDVLVTDVRDRVGGPYRIEVNRTCCTITIYSAEGENDYIIPVVSFVCSVGLPGTPTPTGIYYTGAKYRWKTLMGPSYGQYVTHVVYGVYFHSVAGYNMSSYNLDPNDYNNLGNPASHGCIRMCVRDAKWMYENVPTGSPIYIYDSESPGPFGKPELPKIPPTQNWDPTDPEI